MNPFNKPRILDRNIYRWSSCEKCNRPYISNDGEWNLIEIPSKDYKKFKCKCGQEYTFINWNENHLLGLNKSRKDNL